jgi:hypothetical protein
MQARAGMASRPKKELALPSGTTLGGHPHGPRQFHFAAIRHTTETSMAVGKAVSARAGIAVQRGWREVAVVTTVVGMMMLAALWTALDTLIGAWRR